MFQRKYSSVKLICRLVEAKRFSNIYICFVLGVLMLVYYWKVVHLLYDVRLISFETYLFWFSNHEHSIATSSLCTLIKPVFSTSGLHLCLQNLSTGKTSCLRHYHIIEYKRMQAVLSTGSWPIHFALCNFHPVSIHFVLPGANPNIASMQSLQSLNGAEEARMLLPDGECKCVCYLAVIMKSLGQGILI